MTTFESRQTDRAHKTYTAAQYKAIYAKLVWQRCLLLEHRQGISLSALARRYGTSPGRIRDHLDRAEEAESRAT